MHHATVRPRNEPPSKYTMRWEFKSWQLFSSLSFFFFKRHNKLQPGEEGEREKEREREEKKLRCALIRRLQDKEKYIVPMVDADAERSE